MTIFKRHHNNLKKSDTWKIQLTITINFISSKDDNDEERVTHPKTNNIEIMISDVTDEIIEKLFNSLKSRCQNNLQLMRAKDFVFVYLQLLYYKCHKINLNRGGLYIDFPDWIKNKKKTMNPVNKKDNQCFQYAVTVALNYKPIKKEPQRITKIKPLINKYYWEEINYPLEKDD